MDDGQRHNSHDGTNFKVFTDCVSGWVIGTFTPNDSSRKQARKRKPSKQSRSSQGIGEAMPEEKSMKEEKQDNNIEGLSEFIEYLAQDIFCSLPTELQTLDYTVVRNDTILQERYEIPLSLTFAEELASLLPVSTSDSLIAYGFLSTPGQDLPNVLQPLLSAYIAAVTAPPPSLQLDGPRPSACEICQRDWIPLTYHHLIPKSVHAKVLKRGWHEEWRLNSVAWLCRACHSMVHGIETNEELAKNWYSVELLTSRDDVQKWCGWIQRVRWKAK